MPLFNSKFTTAKTTSRKKLDFHSQNRRKRDLNDSIVIKLGDQEAEFIKGNWQPITGGADVLRKQVNELKETSQHLQEENRYLKVKMDLLFDMLTESVCKCTERKNRLIELEELVTRKGFTVQ